MKATKRTGVSLLAILLTCCLQAQNNYPLNIVAKTNHPREVQTKEQLIRLMNVYDLSKWTFTKTVNIENGFNVVPHSHPVLTLNTRHLRDDELLLATYIHEQLHWFIDTAAGSKAAFNEIKALYPHPPEALPQSSGDSTSTWYHILICYLEYRALVQLIGELKTFQVISFWQQDHYTWIYKEVWENNQKLEGIIQKHRLIP
ncbi:hypothetical protein D3H65_28475 [Paraflavitalea soli]|uniref:Uncharacterized protein n=1 Tax=Paraflavitalea soli TaxID=2315862 RepID=A0A3B7MUU4_9BACT|nr:hypothetical protein [Paraflavitalea soli]AXY77677.1 hypothetical protein D3H65_28475 [Paraflavitalea soli]